MTTRDELLRRLKGANVKGLLNSVLDEAINRIATSPGCEVEASELRQSAAHYAEIG